MGKGKQSPPHVKNCLPYKYLAGATATNAQYLMLLFTDSPNLGLIVEPKFILKNNFDNITVQCRVAPYKEGRLVAFSWLKVTRNQIEIGKVIKHPFKEGPYNLTLYLSRDDFGNVTTLVVTCQGTMQSGGCRNITKVLTLLGLYSVARLVFRR